MRLLSFTLAGDPALRTGVLAHDGARVVDLTEIGVASFAEGAARAGQLARVAGHLLHAPGAVAHAPSAVRLAAPASALAAVYDAAAAPAATLPAGGGVVPLGAPLGPDATVPVSGGAVLGAGIAAVLGRAARAVPAGEAEPYVAGLALVLCWRDGAGRIESAALGPWLATLDEFTGARAAPVAVSIDAALAVNGAVARGGSWSALAGRVAAAVADASRARALAPGDAVAVVTFETAEDAAGAAPSGAAGLHQLRGRHRFGAVPGDEVVVEATHLGALRTRVVSGRAVAAAG